MRTANIRELKHDTSTVLNWVAEGESVEITRHNQIVGVIIPATPAAIRKPTASEFYARLESLFYDRTRPMTGTEIVSYGRGDR